MKSHSEELLEQLLEEIKGLRQDLVPKTKRPRPKANQKSVPIWDAYSVAYKLRYGVHPVRNVKVNSQLSQVVDRVGLEEAPLLAEFYLQHEDRKYNNCGHSVGMLLIDCEKLWMEMKSGNLINVDQSRRRERRQTNLNSFKGVVSEQSEVHRKTKGSYSERVEGDEKS